MNLDKFLNRHKAPSVAPATDQMCVVTLFYEEIEGRPLWKDRLRLVQNWAAKYSFNASMAQLFDQFLEDPFSHFPKIPQAYGELGKFLLTLEPRFGDKKRYREILFRQLHVFEKPALERAFWEYAARIKCLRLDPRDSALLDLHKYLGSPDKFETYFHKYFLLFDLESGLIPSSVQKWIASIKAEQSLWEFEERFHRCVVKLSFYQGSMSNQELAFYLNYSKNPFTAKLMHYLRGRSDLDDVQRFEAVLFSVRKNKAMSCEVLRYLSTLQVDGFASLKFLRVFSSFASVDLKASRAIAPFLFSLIRPSQHDMYSLVFGDLPGDFAMAVRDFFLKLVCESLEAARRGKHLVIRRATGSLALKKVEISFAIRLLELLQDPEGIENKIELLFEELKGVRVVYGDLNPCQAVMLVLLRVAGLELYENIDSEAFASRVFVSEVDPNFCTSQEVLVYAARTLFLRLSILLCPDPVWVAELLECERLSYRQRMRAWCVSSPFQNYFKKVVNGSPALGS